MSPLTWLPLLVIFFLAGAYLELPWLVLFSTALMLVIGLAFLWKKHSLDRVYYLRRWRYRRGFPGESNEVRIEVENRKRLPISWMRVTDPWPAHMVPHGEQPLALGGIIEQAHLVGLFSMRSFERILRNYTLTFQQRGIYHTYF